MSRRVRPYIFTQSLMTPQLSQAASGSQDASDDVALPTESVDTASATNRASLAPPGTLSRQGALAMSANPAPSPAAPTPAQQSAALLAQGITSLPSVNFAATVPQAALAPESLAAMPSQRGAASAAAPHPLDSAFLERANQWMEYATKRLVDIDDGTVFSTQDLTDIRHVINQAASSLDSLLQEARDKGSPEAQSYIQSKIVSLAQGFKQYSALTGEQEQTSRSALNYLRQTDYMVQSAAIQASAQNNMRVGAALSTNINSPGVMGPGGMPMPGMPMPGMPMNGAPMMPGMGGVPGMYPNTGYASPYGPYPTPMLSTPFPPTITASGALQPAIIR